MSAYCLVVYSHAFLRVYMSKRKCKIKFRWKILVHFFLHITGTKINVAHLGIVKPEKMEVEIGPNRTLMASQTIADVFKSNYY
jgi:hypothetical protein